MDELYSTTDLGLATALVVNGHDIVEIDPTGEWGSALFTNSTNITNLIAAWKADTLIVPARSYIKEFRAIRKAVIEAKEEYDRKGGGAGHSYAGDPNSGRRIYSGGIDTQKD